MPRKPPHPCSTPGCGGLVIGASKCAECASRYEQGRGTAAQRGYGSAWQHIRASYLKRHRACVVCGQPATDADHVTLRKTLIARGVRNPDHDAYLQALCHKHHSSKTAGEIGWTGRPSA